MKFYFKLLVGLLVYCLLLSPVVWDFERIALAGERPSPLDAETIRAVSTETNKQLGDLVTLYKTLHSHPELSLREEATAGRLAKRLRDMGFVVTENVGGHGIVAVCRNGDGPTVFLRADMDALPVTENTGLAYASKTTVTRPDGTKTGVMQACGHDVHCTVLMGAAKNLVDLEDRWKGTVILVLQPAEEIGKGAQMMIDAGLFEKFPKPDVCLALHVDSNLPAGEIGYTSGWCSANVDSVDITIFGKGGHGAAPHMTVDPIVTAAYVIVSLQTIVSRRVNPIEEAVVTVGSIHGGTKHNVIPNEVKLQLTVRSYTDEVRKQLLDSIRQITTDICKAMRTPKPPEIVVNRMDEYTPAAYNDPDLVTAAVKVFEQVIGSDNVVERPQVMGGEDFGRYARRLDVPGFMFRLGSIGREKYDTAMRTGQPLPSLHSGLYYPDPEPTIRTGVRAFSALALSILRK